MAKKETDLFERLRKIGLRKQAAKALSGASENAGKKAQGVARAAVTEIAYRPGVAGGQYGHAVEFVVYRAGAGWLPEGPALTGTPGRRSILPAPGQRPRQHQRRN